MEKAMKLDPHLAGVVLEPFLVKTEWRETMNYAAAVFDDNPFYFDDEKPDGIVAHPMFAAAATWPVAENLAGHIREGSFPREALAFLVHHEEHIFFHRLVRPGEELAISGKIAAILPRRSGARAVVRLEATDAQKRPVFTEHIGAVLRGVECDGPGKGQEALPNFFQASFDPDQAPGENPWRAEIPIPNWMPHIYDGCSGISFPIHTSPKFARGVGLPGVILQGTALLAIGVREIVNREAKSDPRALRELFGRFTAMVEPGSAITVQKTGESSRKGAKGVHFEIINEKGQRAVSGGYAAVSDFA
jgi:acyl dehydratase